MYLEKLITRIQNLTIEWKILTETLKKEVFYKSQAAAKLYQK